MLPFHDSPCRVSIHRQILLIASLPALMVTFVLLFFVYQNNIKSNRQLLEQQGQLLAAQIAGALEYELASGARDQLAGVVSAAVKPAADIFGTAVREVIVTDQNGRRLFELSKQTPLEATGAVDTARADSVSTRFSATIALQAVALDPGNPPPPRPLGQVTVDLELSRALARWWRRLLWDLCWIFLTFGVSAGLAFWGGRRISSAIQRIAGAILSIKNGDLNVRLPKTDTNELGTLQDGVNLLADTIRRGKEYLEAELSKVRGEYQQAMEALQVQTRAAEQANEAKSLFLAKVSHEMRTPLYSIKGSVEQLLQVNRDGAESRTLKIIQNASETLYRHISNILNVTHLAQMEREGEMLSEIDRIDLWTELESVVALYEPLMVPRALYLDIIVAPNVPATVKSNAGAIHEILSNLMSNAVKYTQVGGIAVWLETVVRSRNELSERRPALRLRVADSGCGIPSDQLEAIFKEFKQVEETLNRRYEGTGLGLSIIKRNCERLGGHVTVASSLGRGSTFTVELPFQPAGESASGRPAALPVFAGVWRVLVADERASFRASIVSRFNVFNLEVEEQAVSLVALAAAWPPDQLYSLLVVQNVASLEQAILPEIIAGLRRWADVILAMETDYHPDAVQRLRAAGVDRVLWSGSTRAGLREMLEPLFRGPAEATDSAIFGYPLAPLSGRTVLVVEDYDINREIMVNQLGRNGARVLEAGDGETAVAMAEEPGIDLILMDIQMPGKDGISAIQDIRRLAHGARLPILGFTASADQPTHQRVLRAGADGVLTKPVSEADLVKEIRLTIQKAAASPWKLGH